MTKLIRERLGEIAEIAEIASYLCRAIPLCDARNQLAHGIWWRFVAETGAVAVSTTGKRTLTWILPLRISIVSQNNSKTSKSNSGNVKQRSRSAPARAPMKKELDGP
jgi:hypothetical protein